MLSAVSWIFLYQNSSVVFLSDKAGIKDPEMHRQAETILSEIGHFFQVQDDYIDCFSDPKVTGEHGTDIETGKCSWLVVVALQRATQAQRKIIEVCYTIFHYYVSKETH